MDKIKILILTGTILSISGCSNGKQNSRPDQKEEREFSFGSLRDSNLFAESSIDKDKLWKSSLDALDKTPILVADYKGGIITTDWHSQKLSSIRHKLTIRIKDDNSLNVTAFKQVLKNKTWIDDGLDSHFSHDIKEKILKNERH